VSTKFYSTERAVDLSAALLLCSFFLPWFNFLQENVSGLQLALLGSRTAVIWLIPCCTLTVLLLNRFHSAKYGAIVGAVTGLGLSAIGTFLLYLAGSHIRKALSIGGFLLIISTLLLSLFSIILYKSGQRDKPANSKKSLQ
jgi:hypothetical protein